MFEIAIKSSSHDVLIAISNKRTLHFDLNVYSGRKVQAHKSINRPFGWVYNVDQALMNAHLVLIPGSLVNESGAVDRVPAALCWKRYRAKDGSSASLSGLNDSDRGGVNDLVIIGADFDADSGFLLRFLCFFLIVRHTNKGRGFKQRKGESSGEDLSLLAVLLFTQEFLLQHRHPLCAHLHG